MGRKLPRLRRGAEATQETLLLGLHVDKGRIGSRPYDNGARPVAAK